jgi:thiamine pyrophosphokinase
LRAVVFANGLLTGDLPADLFQAGDLIIAADGGAQHCRRLGIHPQVLIGDLDSLDAEAIEYFRQAGARIIPHSRRKDHTDLELALLHAREAGAEEALVLGALGLRWDQTLANLLLPAAEGLSDLRIRLVDGLQEIFLVRPGEDTPVPGQPGDTVSLIPLGGDAAGITTLRLEYPLENGTLRFGSTRGVSNVLLEPGAAVRLDTGMLLCVVIHKR